MILILDNRDSYTFNLAQRLRRLTRREVRVISADDVATALALVRADQVRGVVISPGPGHPDCAADFAGSASLIDWIVTRTELPLLGVCLGHQGLARRFGYRVVPARAARHGWVSTLSHTGDGLFAGVQQGTRVTRYHSLEVVPGDAPDPRLRVTARSEDGVMQAFEITDRPWFGVQFHPESIASGDGDAMLQNFVDRVDPPHRLRVRTLPLPGTAFAAARTLYRRALTRPGAFWLEFDGWILLGDRVGAARAGAADFADLAPGHRRVIGGEGLPFRGGAVGWFSYERGVRELGIEPPVTDVPDSHWVWPARYVLLRDGTAHVCAVDGDPAPFAERVEAALAAADALPAIPPVAADAPEMPGRWRLPDAAYLDAIAECQAALRRGDSYELCLTNRFTTDPCSTDPLDLFEVLRANFAAPHAALIEDEVTVVTASPELFLRGRNGVFSSKPMKGTAPRGATPEADAELAAGLARDPKTVAENLMIVDLLRNDLGRVCRAGSVEVTEYLAVETYPAVHQLVSTVTGVADCAAAEVARALFPGGSMTGAPKRRSVELLLALEGAARGVYSGVLGFFGADGQTELAMVIRAAVRTGSDARAPWTVGAGGAIVLDSDPAAELAEVQLKAGYVRRALARVARPAPEHPAPDRPAPPG